MLTVSTFFIFSYITYLMPMSLYHGSEIYNANDKFSDLKNKNYVLLNSKGDTVTFDGIKAKVIFLEFGYSSCVPCILKLPTLQKLKNIHKENKNIMFINIVDGRADSFEVFKEEAVKQSINFDLFLYAQPKTIESIANIINIKGYPFEKVYSEDFLIFTHVGFSDEEEPYYFKVRSKAISKLLNDEKIEKTIF